MDWRLARLSGLVPNCMAQTRSNCRSPATGGIPRKWLKLLQVGELLHQLFHAVPGEEDRQLGIFSLALPHQDGSFAVLRVANALTLLQVGCSCRCGDLHGRP